MGSDHSENSLDSSYRERLIGYLDVMGFKELLKRGEETKLVKYFEVVSDIKKRQKQINAGIDILAMSDAIVFVMDLPDKDKREEMFSVFVMAIAGTQSTLAFDHDIWTRGAISYGKVLVSVEDNFLAGEAFVRAFELEKHANYPRVLIDPKIMRLFDYSAANFAEDLRSFNVPIMIFGERSTIAMPNLGSDFLFVDWIGHKCRLWRDKTDEFGRELQLYDLNEVERKVNRFNYNAVQRQMNDIDLFQKCHKLLTYCYRSSSLFLSEQKRNPYFDEKTVPGALKLRSNSAEAIGIPHSKV